MFNDTKLIVVFQGSILEADVARSVLEAHGFRAFLKDEAMGTLMPWYTAAGSVGPVKVVVPESEAERARAVLEQGPSQDPEQ